MAIESLDDRKHERADNNLCKAHAILGMIQHKGPTCAGAEENRADVIWAAMDLIEEARDLYGKY